LGSSGLLLLGCAHTAVLALIHAAGHGSGCGTGTDIANDRADTRPHHGASGTTTSSRANRLRQGNGCTWYITSGLGCNISALRYVNLCLFGSLAP
jgi:hypothetical protein